MTLATLIRKIPARSVALDRVVQTPQLFNLSASCLANTAEIACNLSSGRAKSGIPPQTIDCRLKIIQRF